MVLNMKTSIHFVISRSFLLITRNISNKGCRETRNTRFVFNNIFSKIVPFMTQFGRATDENIKWHIMVYIKVKWSRYSPGVAQRVGRGIALLFHDRGTRRGWVVSSTFRPHFTPGKDPVPIVQEAGWTPGPVWTGGKSRPHWDSIPYRLARFWDIWNIQIR